MQLHETSEEKINRPTGLLIIQTAHLSENVVGTGVQIEIASCALLMCNTYVISCNKSVRIIASCLSLADERTIE